MEKKKAIEVLKDLVISIRNHKIGIPRSDPDHKRFEMREEALQTALSCLEQVGKLEEEVRRLSNGAQFRYAEMSRVKAEKLERENKALREALQYALQELGCSTMAYAPNVELRELKNIVLVVTGIIRKALGSK